MAPSRVFQVTNWKPYTKNTLRGFFTVTLPSGLVIHNCTLHQKQDSRWVGMPSQKFTKEDGTTSYTPVIEFTNREASDRFRDAVLEALDRLQGVAR
jgi:DNA-binding cell septation regulator SpoVG